MHSAQGNGLRSGFIAAAALAMAATEETFSANGGGVGTITPLGEAKDVLSEGMRMHTEQAELVMFERAAKEVAGITDPTRAKEILVALGAAFLENGKDFYWPFPGSSKRTARLIGPKGETKMTSNQKAARARSKAARKARKAARR